MGQKLFKFHPLCVMNVEWFTNAKKSCVEGFHGNLIQQLYMYVLGQVLLQSDACDFSEFIK